MVLITEILRGLFISELDQLRMLQNLKNWPPPNIFFWLHHSHQRLTQLSTTRYECFGKTVAE